VSTPATSDPVLIPSPLERDALAPRATPATPATGARVAAGGRKPHVCFVALTAWPVMSGDANIKLVGGAEVQQSMIAPALAARGYRVSMITLDHGQPEGMLVKGVRMIKAYAPDEGVPVVRFLHPRATKLWQALARVDADVYYQRTASVNTAYTAAFCRRHGRHSIYAGASDVDFLPGQEEIKFARDRRIFEWGLRRVDQVFVQNASQMKALRDNYGRDGVLLPNCFATPEKTDVAAPRDYVLWVATIRSSKRPEMLLELARRLPQHKFVVVGGPDSSPGAQAYYEQVAAMAGGLPNVEFRGFMPFAEAERAFDRARVMVNTSLYEGFPNTFLQAWARGVPTVAFVDTGSRRGGMPVYDVVGDLSEMSWKVDRLMREDALWEESSRRVAQHFQAAHSVDAIVGDYERELARVPLAR
jgi:glycosyltransferase involved in cell wall biosynthesis